MMPVFHIIATGPPASGKSQIIRYLSENLPDGYKMKKLKAAIPESFGEEYWIMVVEKKRRRKGK